MAPVGFSQESEIQAQIERHTLDLLSHPLVSRAREEGARALHASIPEPDAGSEALFPAAATEIALNALIAFADGYTGEDQPRLIMRPPRRLDGHVVSGNRGLHDNPDTYYRMIPLGRDSDFLLEGTLGPNPATLFEFSLLTSSWTTTTNLTQNDLNLGPGQTFRLHVGSRPGPAADAFIPVPRDAEMFLIRETLADWSRESPCRLRIENRVDRGGDREGDDERYVEAAARRVEKWFAESIRLTQGPLAQPPNTFPSPLISNEHGKLVTMAYSIGHFRLEPNEALVLSLTPGSAAYVTAPITNLWGTTGARWARGASWNSKQAARNDDGSFTCVVARSDPGVHNWLDPEGLGRGFLFLRWAGLDPDRPPEFAPALRTQLTTLAELPHLMPRETRWIDPKERETLLDRRARDHARRYAHLHETALDDRESSNE